MKKLPFHLLYSMFSWNSHQVYPIYPPNGSCHIWDSRLWTHIVPPCASHFTQALRDFLLRAYMRIHENKIYYCLDFTDKLKKILLPIKGYEFKELWSSLSHITSLFCELVLSHWFIFSKLYFTFTVTFIYYYNPHLHV